MFHRPRNEEETPAAQPAKTKEQQQAPARPQQQQAQGGQAAAARPAQTATTNSATKTEEKKMSKDDQQTRSIDASGATGGFPGGSSPRIPGYGGGAYAGPGGTYGSPSKASQGRRLVIGEGITLSGEIESCEYLVIEGTVEAALKGANVLEVAVTGVFYGAVEIDEATIAGRFEGDITVNGRLTVTSTGSITGSVAYKELALEAGASIDGKVSPLASAGKNASVSKKTEARPAPKAKINPRNDNDGEGSELPFAGTTASA